MMGTKKLREKEKLRLFKHKAYTTTSMLLTHPLCF